MVKRRDIFQNELFKAAAAAAETAAAETAAAAAAPVLPHCNPRALQREKGEVGGTTTASLSERK